MKRLSQLLEVFKALGQEWPACTPQFHRLYTGHWQRTRGAFSWHLHCTNHESHNRCMNNRDVGSQYTVREVLQAHKKGLVSIYVATVGSIATELVVEKAWSWS